MAFPPGQPISFGNQARDRGIVNTVDRTARTMLEAQFYT
jgi:hypothetical protein